MKLQLTFDKKINITIFHTTALADSVLESVIEWYACLGIMNCVEKMKYN